MIAPGTHCIIRFEADKAYLLPDIPIPFAKLGFPPVARTFYSPAWWRIRVLDWVPAENRLFAEVLSYHTGEMGFAPEQLALKEALARVESITFRSINTHGLMTTLRGTRPVTIIAPSKEPYFHPAEDDRDFWQEPGTKPEEYDVIPEPAPMTPAVSVVRINRTIREKFSVPLKEVRFQHGGVTVERYIRELGTPVSLEIPNPELREEFDAVKNYFSNVLKAKKIQVFAEIFLVNGEITGSRARSPEIERINKYLIENVKFEFVQDTVKKRMAFEVDRSLFTMDELFESATDGRVKAGAFYQSERDLFEDLLQITDTKHYRHLRYLSSLHAHHIMKLRFVHRPLSFIFLIEGKNHYHLIWETLNTEEATYIWHTPRDLAALRRTLERIEDILNVIKVQGKIAYLNTRQEPFRRILHDYSNLTDGFVKWKGEMDSILN